MRSRRSLPCLLLLLPLAVGGCTRAPDPWAGTPSGQKKVLAMFAPLYCFAANVAGDKARVACLLTGTGPHDYDPIDADAVAKVAGADVFLINGLELDETIADKLMRRAKNTTGMVEVAEALPHKLLLHTDQDEKAEKEPAGHKHEHGDHDPHVSQA